MDAGRRRLFARWLFLGAGVFSFVLLLWTTAGLTRLYVLLHPAPPAQIFHPGELPPNDASFNPDLCDWSAGHFVYIDVPSALLWSVGPALVLGLAWWLDPEHGKSRLGGLGAAATSLVVLFSLSQLALMAFSLWPS